MAIDDVDDDPTVGGDQAPGAFPEPREVGQLDLPDRRDLGRGQIVACDRRRPALSRDPSLDEHRSSVGAPVQRAILGG
jgi:hypothetical protein